MRKYDEHVTVTKAKEAYSILSQAVKMAEAEYGALRTWELSNIVGYGSSEELANYILPYLKVRRLCYRGDNRCGSSVKSLNDDYSVSLSNNVYAILENGMSVAFWSEASGKASVRFDINNIAPPNKFGVDTFSFYRHPGSDSFLPLGTKVQNAVDANTKLDVCCQYSTDSRCPDGHNGKSCTAWVIYKGNMDYLRRQVSWDE